MLKIVVCVSGGGTNLQAILDSLDAGKITNTEILAVISNNAGAKALERAGKRGIPGLCISPKAYRDREAFNEALQIRYAAWPLTWWSWQVFWCGSPLPWWNTSPGGS